MTTVTPEQTKVEAGGSYAKAELVDRTPLWVGILAFGVSMLSLGLAWWAIDKARNAETQVLLLREDIRQMTIEQAKEK